MLALHFLVEAPEKIFRHGLGRAVDQPLTELRNLASDRGMHGVRKLATTFVRCQPDLGAAFSKTRRTALTLKRELVAGRWIDIAEGDLAAEFGRTGPILSAMPMVYWFSPVGSTLSQPGMQALSTAGSFSASQACCCDMAS